MTMDLIHQAERDKRVEEAARLYENRLRDHPGDPATVVDLAVLYWSMTDFGAHSALGLPAEFVARASTRSRELLDGCIKKADDPEAIFWRMYFDYADWDRDIAEDVNRLVIEHPRCLVPHFFLVMTGRESIQSKLVIGLRSSLEGSGSTKAHYVLSVLDSCAAGQ